jgi:glutamine amidotransferase
VRVLDREHDRLMVTIVDYQQGNLGSIVNMLRRLGHAASVTSDPAVISAAERLILPGVGAFDRGMDKLDELGLRESLERRVMSDGVPMLGICLGAQLMTRRSDEGQREGLGWVPAETIRFFSRTPLPLPVPAMGWGDVKFANPHWLFADMPPDPRFYFVHAYHFLCDDSRHVIAESHYGYAFAAAFASGNVIGVQFHPEKSHKFGMRLLDTFARHGVAPTTIDAART